MIGLTMALKGMGERLESIEEKVAGKGGLGSAIWKGFIDLSKIVFGGWAAFGFLFVILFHAPLREALQAIPEKVKDAEEIGLLGVSLKSRIIEEAKKAESVQLSESIPRLSSSAIALLLQAPKELGSLYSYTPDDNDDYVRIYLPSVARLASLAELEMQELIVLRANGEAVSGAGLSDAIRRFKGRYPGRIEDQSAESQTWVPEIPVPERAAPQMTWQLTELGTQAVDIILKSIAEELAPE